MRGRAPFGASAPKRCGSGGGLDGDLVAEALDLVSEASGVSLVVAAALEPVSPEVRIVGLVGYMCQMVTSIEWATAKIALDSLFLPNPRQNRRY